MENQTIWLKRRWAKRSLVSCSCSGPGGADKPQINTREEEEGGEEEEEEDEAVEVEVVEEEEEEEDGNRQSA